MSSAPSQDPPEPPSAGGTAAAAPVDETAASTEPAAVEPAELALPYDGAPLPPHTPWVTYALVAANVAIWLLSLALGASPLDPSAQWLLEHGGNLGALTLSGEEWRLVTSMFLHSGILHLGMNMLGLVGGGRLAERMFGRVGFAAIYVIAGLAGSIATALRPGVVSVGASGAIFGVLGAVGAYYLRHRDRMDPRTAKEASGLLAFIAYNILFGLSRTGIDMYAHIGGLAGGFACGLALELGGREPRGRRPLAVAAIGVAAMLAAAFAVPAPVDPQREAFEAFATIERQVQGRWSELVGKAQRQEITDDALAAAIDRDILAPWRDGRAAFEQSGAGGARRDAVVAYLRDMQESWEQVASGLRDHDADAVERGIKRMQDAGAAAQRAIGP